MRVNEQTCSFLQDGSSLDPFLLLTAEISVLQVLLRISLVPILPSEAKDLNSIPILKSLRIVFFQTLKTSLGSS